MRFWQRHAKQPFRESFSLAIDTSEPREKSNLFLEKIQQTFIVCKIHGAFFSIPPEQHRKHTFYMGRKKRHRGRRKRKQNNHHHCSSRPMSSPLSSSPTPPSPEQPTTSSSSPPSSSSPTHPTAVALHPSLRVDAKSQFQRLFLGSGLGYTASDIKYASKQGHPDRFKSPNCQWVTTLNLPYVYITSNAWRKKKDAENDAASKAIVWWNDWKKQILLRRAEHECQQRKRLLQQHPLHNNTQSTSDRCSENELIDLTRQTIYYDEDDEDDEDDDDEMDSEEEDYLDVPFPQYEPRTYASRSRFSYGDTELEQVRQQFIEARIHMEQILDSIQAIIRHQQARTRSQD